MEQDGQGFIHSPPDTHTASGLYRIVEVTNGHVAIYDKSGTLLAGGDSGPGAVDLDAFCGNNGCFDPKVIYDQESNRFVAVALEGSSSTFSFMHVMVSKTSTPNGLTTASWDKFRLDATTTIGLSTGWFDYPGLGVSPDAVVVTGNIFPDFGSILGTKIRVFDKAELYDRDAVATYTDIDTSFLSGGGTIQPAHHFGSPPASTFYLFQRWNASSVRVWALTGVPGSPAVDVFVLSTPDDQGTCVDNAPQMGTSKRLDTVCPRMMNAVWRDGSLWGTLTGSDSTDSRAIVQWFEVATNGYPSSTPTLLQHGAIDGGDGEYTFMPSISVNACGNAGVTYTQSSDARFPEVRYTGRQASDPADTMQAPGVAKTSVSFYDDFTGNSPPSFEERWGDYSATTIDPVDQSFWIAHEYARVAASPPGNNGRWGTWISNFSFGCVVDSDGDGVSDAIDNCPSIPNASQTNTDAQRRANGAVPGDFASNPGGDPQGDACDDDDDDDWLLDEDEGPAGTGPLNPDSDGDRVVDGAEVLLGSDPLDGGSKPPWVPAGDGDSDGLPAPVEDLFGSSDASMDSDGDGFTDGWEVKGYGTSPVALDSDGDVCEDWIEIVDVNGNRKSELADIFALIVRALAGGAGDAEGDAVLDMNKNGVLINDLSDIFLAVLNSDLTKAHGICDADVPE